MTKKKSSEFLMDKIVDFGVKFLKKVVLKFFGQMCSDEFFLKHALLLLLFPASEMSIWTERYQSYESWLSVKHRTSMVFGLHTCYHAEILLSSAPFLSWENDFVYAVVLQDQTNMTS